jgi:hypothetical protein
MCVNLHSLNAWYSCFGTLCSTSEIFVAINDERKVVLYHLSLGFRWPLDKLEGAVSVSSIHRNTGFVIGSCGIAQLVDIPLSRITQVLKQGLSTLCMPHLFIYHIQCLLDSCTGGEEVCATSVCILCQLISNATHTWVTQAFQDETENEFMIATASGSTCMLWKTETVCQ